MSDIPESRYTWSDDTFLSQGTECAVRVYRPTSVQGTPIPVIVMAHGFGAVRALRLYAYAERFAIRWVRGRGVRLSRLRRQCRYASPAT